LSTPYQIAKKISFQKQKSDTRFIVRLSIGATAISVAAIILTLSIVNGFQQSISEKVYNFWGHIRIASVSGEPIKDSSSPLNNLPYIKKAIPFINQSMVIAYGQDIEGVVARAIPTLSSIPFLVKGRGLQSAGSDSIINEIVISEALASKLKIPLNSTIKLYALTGSDLRQRKMKVVGFYHSGIEEYDRQFVMIDLHQLQYFQVDKKNIEGYSVFVKDIHQLEEANNEVQRKIPKNWVATKITDYYPQIFDWIGVQTINRNVTITILLIIAIVNLITCLLILMLERVTMIGTLTAMGASPVFLRKVFLYQASFIAWTGIGLGLIIGLGLSWLQMQTGFITLNESAYFIKVLPIQIDLNQIVYLTIGTALTCYISFLIPTLWIQQISPAKAVRFD
jgi:lipoprotein-releasing system permease protein